MFCYIRTILQILKTFFKSKSQVISYLDVQAAPKCTNLMAIFQASLGQIVTPQLFSSTCSKPVHLLHTDQNIHILFTTISSCLLNVHHDTTFNSICLLGFNGTFKVIIQLISSLYSLCSNQPEKNFTSYAQSSFGDPGQCRVLLLKEGQLNKNGKKNNALHFSEYVAMPMQMAHSV